MNQQFPSYESPAKLTTSELNAEISKLDELIALLEDELPTQYRSRGDLDLSLMYARIRRRVFLKKLDTD